MITGLLEAQEELLEHAQEAICSNDSLRAQTAAQVRGVFRLWNSTAAVTDSQMFGRQRPHAESMVEDEETTLPVQVDTLAAGFLQACQAWHRSCERIAARLWHLGLHCGSAATHVNTLVDLLEGKIAAMLLDETRSG